ncbi:alpha-ketoglutarate transporter [compost metagenome]
MFGGSSEYVALSFRVAGVEHYFFYYVTAIVGVTAIASYLMPDLRRYGYLDGNGQVEQQAGFKSLRSGTKQMIPSTSVE